MAGEERRGYLNKKKGGGPASTHETSEWGGGEGRTLDKDAKITKDGSRFEKTGFEQKEKKTEGRKRGGNSEQIGAAGGGGKESEGSTKRVS